MAGPDGEVAIFKYGPTRRLPIRRRSITSWRLKSLFHCRVVFENYSQQNVSGHRAVFKTLRSSQFCCLCWFVQENPFAREKF